MEAALIIFLGVVSALLIAKHIQIIQLNEQTIELIRREGKMNLENLQKEHERMRTDLEIIINSQGMYTAEECEWVKHYWKEVLRKYKACAMSNAEINKFRASLQRNATCGE